MEWGCRWMKDLEDWVHSLTFSSIRWVPSHGSYLGQGKNLGEVRLAVRILFETAVRFTDLVISQLREILREINPRKSGFYLKRMAQTVGWRDFTSPTNPPT